MGHLVDITALGEHSIVTEAAYPIAARLYRLRPEKEDAASKMVKKYLKKGVSSGNTQPLEYPLVINGRSRGVWIMRGLQVDKPFDCQALFSKPFTGAKFF